MIVSIADKHFLLLFFFSSPRLCPLLDVRAAREQMNMGGVTYPTLPMQEAVPRPQSVYGQHTGGCSPAGSFAGSMPPQPHSAYFSGMTGPQHPFYNRVRQERDIYVDNQSPSSGINGENDLLDNLKINKENKIGIAGHYLPVINVFKKTLSEFSCSVLCTLS